MDSETISPAIVATLIHVVTAIGHALEQRGLVTRDELASYVEIGLDERADDAERYLIGLTAKALRQTGNHPPPFTVIDGGKA